MGSRLELFAIPDFPMVRDGDNLPALIADGLARAGLALRECNQFLRRFHRYGGMHHQHKGADRDQRHRREIALQVIGEICTQGGLHRGRGGDQ